MATRWFRHTFVDGRCADCDQALYHDARRASWPKNGATCYSKADWTGEVYYQQREPSDWLPCCERNRVYIGICIDSSKLKGPHGDV